MLKSMTGFGRGIYSEDNLGFTIEMKSVNHRFLDLNIRMPRSIMATEDKIRKIVSKSLTRGKVDIFITQNNSGENSGVATFNKELGDSYFKCLTDIKKMYNLTDEPTLSLLSKFPDVITVEAAELNEEEAFRVLKVALDEAIENIVLMRVKEGEKLKEDLLKKLQGIEKNVDSLCELSKDTVESYRVKLSERVEELLEGSNINVDENRIAQEVAIFADKSCVDEETVRLYSHINQMRDNLNLNEPVGRKLDFIVQEMNREANTIASKANDIRVTNISISLKNEIEKIREQIQNIE
ncbi:YicC family protein [Clostridium bornimense]|uniref:YicC/YloC family endoribonuclease n=1 Tax=Clostridium bornimense TaxID=1216932 RepID=UPI001C1244A0|nr:YicC/YloC family endoribonuclease [Clostridium bornimense]MBU5316291.1 YicC family protein [Clostridium bornimense]